MAEKLIFILLKYPLADTADASAAALSQLSRENIIRLKDAVALTRTEKGYIQFHPILDNTEGTGFLKEGLACALFALLFGPEEWREKGASVGSALAEFDPLIKNKLVEELEDKMTQDASAVAVLVVQADWRKAVARMAEHHFGGTIVISQNVLEDLTAVENLLEDEMAVASLPNVVSLTGMAIEVDEEPSEPAEVVEAPVARRPKKLEYIEGIGPVYSQRLYEAKILTVEDLLERGSTPQGRKEIVKTTGISSKLILRWVNMADLYRIKGIGSEYAELLEAAGVDTVPELAQRKPANLLEKMVAANETKKMVRRLPVLSQVESWVEQAKNLPRVVTY